MTPTLRFLWCALSIITLCTPLSSQAVLTTGTHLAWWHPSSSTMNSLGSGLKSIAGTAASAAAPAVLANLDNPENIQGAVTQSLRQAAENKVGVNTECSANNVAQDPTQCFTFMAQPLQQFMEQGCTPDACQQNQNVCQQAASVLGQQSPCSDPNGQDPNAQDPNAQDPSQDPNAQQQGGFDDPSQDPNAQQYQQQGGQGGFDDPSQDPSQDPYGQQGDQQYQDEDTEQEEQQGGQQGGPDGGFGEEPQEQPTPPNEENDSGFNT